MMFEFRTHGLTADADARTRSDAFGEWFDADVDPSTALPTIVQHLCDGFLLILGEQAKPHLCAMLGIDEPENSWEDAVNDGSRYLEYTMGQTFTELLAFGLFGIRHEEQGVVGSFDECLARAERLVSVYPIDLWLDAHTADLLRAAVSAAAGRAALDRGENVQPEALAHLGGVKFSRIRNMISGASPDLPRDAAGLVHHEAAAAWLATRDVFLPTIQGEHPGHIAEDIEEPIFVPVARDGSIFHPAVKREGGYQIGAKGEEQMVEDFDEALQELSRQATPRWRRPNENGNWGIVAGVEWRRMDRAALEALGTS